MKFESTTNIKDIIDYNDLLIKKENKTKEFKRGEIPTYKDYSKNVIISPDSFGTKGEK